MSKYTRDQIALACDMRERGVFQGVIAQRTGININSLDYIFKRHAADSPRLLGNRITRRNQSYMRHGITVRSFSEDDDQYLTESQDVLTYGEMARHLGRGISSVRNRILILARDAARREALEEAA